MIKKTFYIFSIIFLLSFFILPKSSFAQVSLTVTNITSTTVTINATGLENGKRLNFAVHKDAYSTTTPNYFVFQDEAITNGTSSSNFSALFPYGEYYVQINYEGENERLAGPVNFQMIGPILSFSNITSTTVDFTATGLLGTNSQRYNVVVEPEDLSVDDTHFFSLLNINNGMSTVTADNLVLNTAYNAFIQDTTNLSNNNGIYSSTAVSFSTPSVGSFAKLITSFAFFDLDPHVVGVIDNTSIALSVPTGTDITKLTPTIIVSSGATVSPASGVLKDFTNGVTYTVTAENGTTQVYTALVFVLNNIPGGITLIMKPPTNTSVTFVLSGLQHNKEISFDVINNPDNPATPSYTDYQTYTTDDAGVALFKFQGLSPGGHYKYTHSESTGGGTFWTTGEPISPDPNPDPNPNPTTGGTSGALVPCGTISNPTPCGFNDLFTLIQNVINFILFFMAVPIAAIMFAYAGFMLVTSAGESGKRTKAKEVFVNVAIGLVVVAGAWLIVHTILSIAGYNQSVNWFGL